MINDNPKFRSKFDPKRRTWLAGRIGPALVLCAGIVFILANSATAVPFSTDIQVGGPIEFDEGFPIGEGFDNTGVTGSFSAIEGGVTTSSTYSGTSVNSGTDPIAATFTDVNDGFGLNANVSASRGNEFGVGIDFQFNLLNTSTDEYMIGIEVDYFNRVDADGDDAFADSELTIHDGGNNEVFFTDVISDTLNGDERNGNDFNTFGESVTDTDTFIFYVMLSSLGSETLTGNYTLEGGVFGPHQEATTAELRATITIISVENRTGPPPPPPPNPVPEPGTLVLLAMGLGGMVFGVHRRRRSQNATQK